MKTSLLLFSVYFARLIAADFFEPDGTPCQQCDDSDLTSLAVEKVQRSQKFQRRGLADLFCCKAPVTNEGYAQLGSHSRPRRPIPGSQPGSNLPVSGHGPTLGSQSKAGVLQEEGYYNKKSPWYNHFANAIVKNGGKEVPALTSSASDLPNMIDAEQVSAIVEDLDARDVAKVDWDQALMQNGAPSSEVYRILRSAFEDNGGENELSKILGVVKTSVGSGRVGASTLPAREGGTSWLTAETTNADILTLQKWAKYTKAQFLDAYAKIQYGGRTDPFAKQAEDTLLRSFDARIDFIYDPKGVFANPPFKGPHFLVAGIHFIAQDQVGLVIAQEDLGVTRLEAITDQWYMLKGKDYKFGFEVNAVGTEFAEFGPEMAETGRVTIRVTPINESGYSAVGSA